MSGAMSAHVVTHELRNALCEIGVWQTRSSRDTTIPYLIFVSYICVGLLGCPLKKQYNDSSEVQCGVDEFPSEA